jgi:cobalt-zinc-cadmium efflux system membrane fusion protein
MKIRPAFILLLTFLLVAAESCKHQDEEHVTASSSESTAPENLQTVAVTKEQFITAEMKLGKVEDFIYTETLAANGYLDVPPQNRFIFSPYIGGFVKSTPLLPGDRVRKGQVLITLENIDYLKLQQDFIEAREKLHYLKSVYETQQALANEKISAQKTLLLAQSEYNQMRANYESLARQLRLVNIDPETVNAEHMTAEISLIAPFDGYITKINAIQGMYVNPTDEIGEIVNPDHLHLELKVFEKDVLQVKKGQAVDIRIPQSSPDVYKGEVILVGKTIEGEDRTVSVHAHIEGEQNLRLAPGMYAEAAIHTAQMKMKGLPAEAFHTEQGVYYVFVLEDSMAGNYTFRKVPLHIGKITEDWIEIHEPLKQLQEGASILVKGVSYLGSEM